MLQKQNERQILKQKERNELEKNNERKEVNEAKGKERKLNKKEGNICLVRRIEI